MLVLAGGGLRQGGMDSGGRGLSGAGGLAGGLRRMAGRGQARGHVTKSFDASTREWEPPDMGSHAQFGRPGLSVRKIGMTQGTDRRKGGHEGLSRAREA